MKIELDPLENPVRVKARRYPSNQRMFLKTTIDKLVEQGFLVPNPKASWQCAPLCVPKSKFKTALRLTIDLRPLKAANSKKDWPMPHIESELQDFAVSKVFA